MLARRVEGLDRQFVAISGTCDAGKQCEQAERRYRADFVDMRPSPELRSLSRLSAL
jgi:hypothetical protein